MNDIFVVPLTNSDKICIIDIEDSIRVMEHKWFCKHNKNRNSFCIYRTTYAMPLATFIMQEYKMFDHINRNSFDNRKLNLRKSNSSQNAANRTKLQDCSSQFLRVYWKKQNQKWCVQLKYRGKKIYVGLFEDEIEAAWTADMEAYTIWGPYTNLNFPIGEFHRPDN